MPQNTSRANAPMRRQFALILSLLITTLASGAFAGSGEKLIVIPVSDATNMAKSDANYLYDVMLEAASHALAGKIAMVHEQKTRNATKGQKTCKASCAISAAQKTGAKMALLFEVKKHDGNIVGFLKLLDSETESVLAAKRFFTPNNKASSIEANLQASIRYVLSANFMPLDARSKQDLQVAQTQLPAAAPIKNEIKDIPPPVSPVAQPAPIAPPPVYQEPEEPKQPRQYNLPDQKRKRLYLGLGAGLGVAFVGAVITGAVTATQAVEESDKYDYWQASAQAEYDAGNIDAANDYISKMNEAEQAKNVNTGLAIGFFAGAGLAAFGSTYFFVKFAKLKKKEKQGGLGSTLRLSPMASKTTGGMLLHGTF